MTMTIMMMTMRVVVMVVVVVEVAMMIMTRPTTATTTRRMRRKRRKLTNILQFNTNGILATLDSHSIIITSASHKYRHVKIYMHKIHIHRHYIYYIEQPYMQKFSDIVSY